MGHFAKLFCVASILAVPTAAFATPAECMWRSLSPATKDSLIAAALANSLTAGNLPASEFESATSRCVRGGALKKDAALALVTYVLEQYAEPGPQPHLPRVYLSSAWTNLEPAERAHIRNIFFHYDGEQERTISQAEIDEAVEPIISRLEREHGATMSRNSREFTYSYLIFRSNRESLEARL